MNKKTNIILINCDDLGYGDIGCYGSKINKTPVLDKMAQDGIRFTSFYMASPVCSPSRGAMMTGCYPSRIGFGSFDGRIVLFPGDSVGLNPYEKTIASLLNDVGYSTMIIGKWHCGDQKDFLPTRHGFDHYYGIPYSNDMGRQAGILQGFPPLPLMLDEEVIQEQPDQSSLTERYVEQGIRFIRKNKDKPFFLYFAHMHVHLPLYAPDRFIEQSQNGDYGATVECIDWAAGALIDELKQQGLENDTLIIFTSDNGSRGDHGGSNAPLRGKKGTTWEGGMRVPCIMYWPGKIPAGVVCDEIVTSMDFYPTLANLGNSKIPDDRIIDGVDISDLIFRGDKSPRKVFYYYLMDNLEAVRSGKWKLHVLKGQDEINELYDLDHDIGETINLYTKHPDVVDELLALLDKCRRDIGDSSRQIEGENRRPIGQVENPVTLTYYDIEHPYIISMYDKDDKG
ncbi:MAG: sulfatase family protein [Saccharofermentanales bacterium]